uniref:Uncharacterized protein n=1 Tax=Glossina pallidipes TaxID=7398 RepID=A0A1A9ZTM5_GLOPL
MRLKLPGPCSRTSRISIVMPDTSTNAVASVSTTTSTSYSTAAHSSCSGVTICEYKIKWWKHEIRKISRRRELIMSHGIKPSMEECGKVERMRLAGKKICDKSHRCTV